ncbi:uncharacterized protein AB675_6766 [Cyphellophora attinorum]|uniref:Beta-1,4-mannosyl-glycoprotein 4-beta-N-acetylglucosaminyltransferase n=1 Tax=Cyphellophora attinorum TaxID=1664694 RepID=A0A0N1H8C6_9EURO|nr:uncharacterized protein AB675_6766 [Phialophora attinorum]KPI43177.1 hypothetical protein AB675_6766 [Phialophora attinorum]
MRARRPQWSFIALLLLTSCGIYYFAFSTPNRNDDTSKAHSHELDDAEAKVLCKQHHLALAPDRARRKIYDLVTINTELDLLEIRLHTLAEQVDYFVLAVSTHTFTGVPKPPTEIRGILNLTESPRFADFRTKILFHVFRPDQTGTTDPWALERAQRNSLLSKLLSIPAGSPESPKENDILLVSDIDEIPRPSALTLLRTCTFPTPRITLSTTAHLYSFNTIHSLPQKRHWLHPQATIWRSTETIWPEDLRTSASKLEFKSRYRVIGDAGWHCSSCFSTIAEFQAKIRGFSHQEFNHPVFLDPAQIVRRVKNGVDLAEREWEKFVKVGETGLAGGSGSRADGIVKMPDYLWENKDRFPWLIDRDAENARFLDWDGPGAASLEEWNGEMPDKWPD